MADHGEAWPKSEAFTLFGTLQGTVLLRFQNMVSYLSKVAKFLVPHMYLPSPG